jgi:hypothetical protein
MPQVAPISSLRQRLTDDMTLRAFSPKTHRSCIRSVNILAEFRPRSPVKATAYNLWHISLIAAVVR